MASSSSSVVFSNELLNLANFSKSLTDIEKIIKPVLSKPLNELHEKLPPIDRAKLDLAMAFVLNSTFWMYLKTIGEDPEEHNVNYGLERIRNYMKSVEEIVAKKDAPRLDVGAAKRFVRHSLWEADGDDDVAASSEDLKKDKKPEFKQKISKSSNLAQNKKLKTQFKKNIKHKKKQQK